MYGWECEDLPEREEKEKEQSVDDESGNRLNKGFDGLLTYRDRFPSPVTKFLIFSHYYRIFMD